MNKAQIKNIFGSWRKILMQYTWWELVIFVVGSVSFISMLIVLFLPVGNGHWRFISSGKEPLVSSPEFTQILAKSLALPLRQGDSIQTLNNGDAFLKSFLADIDGAHSSIDIMVYIWSEGKMSDQVLEHLDQKLKQGVQVRIMYDAYGSLTNKPSDKFNTFKDLGGKISVFHSF